MAVRRAAIPPGEGADVALYYQPLSENPVFALGDGKVLSATDKNIDDMDVFGTVFSLQ